MMKRTRRRKKPLPDQVRALRTTAGLTQAQLATRCGWAQHVQSELETGKRPLTLQRLMRLADALDVVLFCDGKTWELWRPPNPGWWNRFWRTVEQEGKVDG